MITLGIKKQALIISSFLGCQILNAGTMGPIVEPCSKFYIGVDGGYSVSSLLTNLRPDTTNSQNYQFFFVTPLNTDYQGGIGSAGMIGGFIGYNLTEQLSVNFNYDYRGQYSWKALSRYGVELGSTETYKANISIQTFLFNLVLSGSDAWHGLTPYVNAGIGVGYNSLRNFQNASVNSPSTTHPPTQIYSLTLSNKNISGFAWDAGVGFDYLIGNNAYITMGYRFVDAGRLRSSSQFTEIAPSGVTTSTITPFQTGHALFNEFLISLRWEF